jgi:hypothetical protein
MYSSTAKTLGLAAVLGLLPVVAVAAPPQGEWQGVIQQANSDVATSVRFDAQRADVLFQEPFMCRVPATFLKDDGVHVFYRFGLSPNGGRFCDNLVNRDMAVTPGADGRLTIAFNSGKATWQGTFSSMPAQPPHPTQP